MTPTEYAAARKARGSQAAVARALGLALSTLQRREWGEVRISREQELALLALPIREGEASWAGRKRGGKLKS